MWCEEWCFLSHFSGRFFSTRVRARELRLGRGVSVTLVHGYYFNTRVVARSCIVRGVDWEVSTLSLRVYFFLPALERERLWCGSGDFYLFSRVDFFLPASWVG